MPTRSRVRLFAALAAACVLGVVALAVVAIVGSAEDRAAGERAVRDARPTALRVLTGDAPFVVFRSVDRSRPATYGRVEVAALRGTTPGPAVLAGPPCSRVAFAAGRGLCLDVLGTETAVRTLDGRLRVLHSFTTGGIPSRARVSPDGRWGGVTMFVVGHAYAKPGSFSTATTLIDMRTGRPVGNLERAFEVYRDGALVTAQDRNFWGLTFAPDGDTFYATLALGGRTYLIKGSIRARRAQTIRENVECPSVSPDGTRIAYKKAVAHDPTVWRFHVLDLRSGADVALAETRSVDDQLAWLDDGHLLYGDGTATWMVAADGSGRPQRWIGAADSPTVARPAG